MLSKWLYLAVPAIAASTTHALAVPSSSSSSGQGQLVFEPTEELTLETWQSVQKAAARAWDVVKDETASLASQAEETWEDVQGAFGDGIDRTLEIVDPFVDTVKHKTTAQYGHDEPLDLSKYTIGQILNWTLRHSHDDSVPTLPLHKLAFLVNVSKPVQEALYDEKADLTLFAPDDEALTPPHRRHDQHGPHPPPHHPPHHGGPPMTQDEGDEDEAFGIMAQHPFWKATRHFQRQACPHYRPPKSLSSDDEERKERRKKFLLGLLEAVLKYHVSPKAKKANEILDSSTLPTALKIAHDEDAPAFRVRVGEPSLLPGVPVKLNFFSSLSTRPILAKNGVIYIISRAPLLPPLSPLSQLFLFPDPFSTLTSAVQKVGFAEHMLPHFGNKTLPLAVEGEGEDQVDERVLVALKDLAEEKHQLTKNSFTIFAPTNKAFKALGFELNAFLFSPFGAPALRWILKYHIVPGLIFHTDHIDNVTSTVVDSIETDVAWPTQELGGGDFDGIWDGPPHLPHPPRPPHGPTPPGQVNVTHYSLPTLLGSRSNETLAVDVVQYRLRLGHGPLARRVVVKPSVHGPKHGPHGHPLKPISAVIADGVAWGGAVHVIPELIAPPIPPHHHGDHGHGGHGEGSRLSPRMLSRLA